MFKKMITRAIAVTLALPILIATPLRASAADAIPDNSEWNAFVEEKIEKDDPPGLAVTLVNGSDVSFKNWGYANIKEQTPVTEDTVFGIASCSKAFTALSVYLLQEDKEALQYDRLCCQAQLRKAGSYSAFLRA